MRSKRWSSPAGTTCPRRELPWNLVTDQAELQGISEADVIWDIAGRRKEDPAPRIKPPAKRPAKRTTNGRRKSTTYEGSVTPRRFVRQADRKVN